MPCEEIRSITLELPAYYVIFLAYSARLQNKPTCDGPHILIVKFSYQKQNSHNAPNAKKPPVSFILHRGFST